MERQLDELHAADPEISGHHPAAPGRCGAGHVHDCQAAGPAGRPDPQHHSVLRSGLRAGRPHDDQVGIDQGRRHPSHGRPRQEPPPDQTGRSKEKIIKKVLQT